MRLFLELLLLYNYNDVWIDYGKIDCGRINELKSEVEVQVVNKSNERAFYAKPRKWRKKKKVGEEEALPRVQNHIL